MLLSFSGENVRSFRDPFFLELEASRVSEKEVIRWLPWRQGGRPLGVLPVAGVFGANGSGKSNLLRAMNDLQSFVLYSFRLGQPNGGMPRREFALESKAGDSPSTYSVSLILDGVRHDYSITINSDRVLTESAYSFPYGRRRTLFERHDDQISFPDGDVQLGKQIAQLLRPNALFYRLLLQPTIENFFHSFSGLSEIFSSQSKLIGLRDRHFRLRCSMTQHRGRWYLVY
jgi:hypothetical protein